MKTLKTNWKRGLLLLLCLMTCAGMLPATAFAADDAAGGDSESQPADTGSTVDVTVTDNEDGSVTVDVSRPPVCRPVHHSG